MSTGEVTKCILSFGVECISKKESIYTVLKKETFCPKSWTEFPQNDQNPKLFDTNAQKGSAHIDRKKFWTCFGAECLFFDHCICIFGVHDIIVLEWVRFAFFIRLENILELHAQVFRK